MAAKTAALKQAIQKQLAKRGYAIIRTEPRTKATDVLYTEAELQRLDRDLAKLPLNPQDYQIWTSAAAVRSYLKDERINFYHKLVAAVAAKGVDLERKSVLDVGTCSGYLLRIVGDRYPGGSLAGTDYYEECVRLSAALVPGAKVFQASIADLASTTEKYDVVFCTEVLEHILDTETQIPTLLDLVAPGGALIVTVPNGTFDFTGALTSEDGISYGGHVNFWSKQSWEYYIERIAPDHRTEFGALGVNFDDDALFAVIFQE